MFTNERREKLAKKTMIKTKSRSKEVTTAEVVVALGDIRRSGLVSSKKTTDFGKGDEGLFSDVCRIVDAARGRVANTANAEIILMYWAVGTRINKDVLGGKRARYGEKTVGRLSENLCLHYVTREFNLRNLRRMMQFAQQFPDFEIVSRTATQLSWSHIVEILPLRNGVQREFYLTLAATQRWGRDELRAKIDGMLFERTAISGKPEDFIRRELSAIQSGRELSPDLVFKNPYFLDFTGLKGFYSERDLEDVLITGIQSFLLELGTGFAFLARQKHMVIDGEDYFLDLLFYHRSLRRLIAVELKKTRFRAAYKGQMELYLRWLDKYERQSGEESPLGLILCADGSDEQIELLQLGDTGIRVARYLTVLPDRKTLRDQLKRQMEAARSRLLSLPDGDERHE